MADGNQQPCGERPQVHVTDLQGAERDAAWERFTQMSDGFRAYGAKTDRVIPVLRLTPVR